ncbi:hypothetical protein PILCRDRAFT_726217 [Piloderma croceum F 1598]|uniref:Uncharacterized protein n=1 Tax=Piloderma croceum (strain F 1598) TaxID=765440 RepID=A0A0C3B860_PILCF|nr:hypothetical protein PILCRDRAFT_726217 [Piloderma croceum F 1598]
MTMTLLVATMVKMIGMMIVVILTAVDAREAASEAGQEEKILVSMNWTLPNLISFQIYLTTTNIRKQQVASKCDIPLLYLQYGVYDPSIPASFIRSAPPIMTKAKFPAPPRSPQAKRIYTPNDYLPIILTSETGQGATGVVHHGTLELKRVDRSAPLDVVVKLAI